MIFSRLYHSKNWMLHQSCQLLMHFLALCPAIEPSPLFFYLCQFQHGIIKAVRPTVELFQQKKRVQLYSLALTI